MKTVLIGLLLMASLIKADVFSTVAVPWQKAVTKAVVTEVPAAAPTAEPTVVPSAEPTAAPTAEPTAAPTAEPTAVPTAVPTAEPTAVPTAAPTAEPTAVPTVVPTAEPTAVPTAEPTAVPTASPTAEPTAAPTAAPTAEPTAAPTAEPTAAPTAAPTAEPTAVPTAVPTAEPTKAPTAEPASDAAAMTAKGLAEELSASSAAPTAEVTATEPTAAPTAEVNATESTAAPTAEATAEPTAEPTAVPAAEPTAASTAEVNATESTAAPTAEAAAEPTAEPTAVPTAVPAAEPTAAATAEAPSEPTSVPTAEAAAEPTAAPTAVQETAPTAAPTEIPATEPTKSTASDSTPVSQTQYVLNSDPEAAEPPVRTRPETPETTYQKIFPYSDNVVLKGIFEKNGYFFQIPKYWDTQYVLAQIEYTVSPLIDHVPASLTFFINDIPIYSCAVQYENGVSQVAYVTIPVSEVKEGYNEFSISGYVRLYDDDGCLDDFSGANWISISKNSFIEAGYELKSAAGLCDYPYPLMSTMDETGARVTVYVPEDALPGELTAAFMIRADMGNEISGEDQIQFRSLKYLSRDKDHAVIIARRDRLPQAAAEQYPDVLASSEGCLIYEFADNGRYYLVITGENEEHLKEGAAMLMDESRVSQETDWQAFVPAGSIQTVTSSRALSELINNGTTIKGITDQNGIDFVGPFHQEAVIYLPLSGGFVLGEGGKMELMMRYSDNLDFDRSMVTVYWGDIPVASRKLEKEKSDADTFSFLMPSDVVGTHAGSIKIAFDLEIEELYCTKRADQMPWAYISGNSTLHLPAGGSTLYDLSLRPFPFQELGSFNHLAVVVPANMTDRELALFGRLAALYGVDASPYGELKVWKDQDFPAEGENVNIITLGTWKDNLLIQKLNDKLSFRFAPDGTRLESNQQLMMNAHYSETVGVLQMIRSPWQSGRIILAATSASDEALERIERFGSIRENTWRLTGDAFLIDENLETKNYRFMEKEADRKPTIQEQIAANRDAVLFTLISTGAMLLILIAVILILVRYRGNRRKEAGK